MTIPAIFLRSWPTAKFLGLKFFVLSTEYFGAECENQAVCKRSAIIRNKEKQETLEEEPGQELLGMKRLI